MAIFPVPILSRGFVDRDEASRLEPRRVIHLRRSSRARYVLLSGEALAARGESGLEFVGAEEALARSFDVDAAYYLGTAQETPYFAIDLTDTFGTDANRAYPEAQIGGFRWCALVAFGNLWPELDAALATEALAICNAWRQQRFCEKCGEPLRVLESGWIAVCSRGHPTYPRTDAAVIMAIFDDADRVLLAQNARWPGTRHSILAGFVEAGEPLEKAVRREVAEEVGIEVGAVEYFGSQPWPFPRSLMLGFFGHTSQSEVDIVADHREIARAGFYTRQEVIAAARAGEITLPRRTSIAAAMLTHWLGSGDSAGNPAGDSAGSATGGVTGGLEAASAEEIMSLFSW